MRTTPAAVLLAVLASACGGSGVTAPQPGSADDTDLAPASLTIAEPVHSLGYLPLYVAEAEGFLADENLTVEFATLAGGGHVNALLSGEAWAFIGGPESGAVANVRGADTVAIANVVNRGMTYLVARADLDVDATEIPVDEAADLLAGSSILTGRYGGTPNAVMRHILQLNGLDAETDVSLTEVDDSGAILASVARGGVDFAITSEPQLGQGIDEGVWTEPIINVPEQLGPYAFSSIVTSRRNLEEDPELAQRFVRALVRAQQIVEGDATVRLRLRKRNSRVSMRTSWRALWSNYADELWDSSVLSVQAVGLALDVARSGQILDDEEAPITAHDMMDDSVIDAVLNSLD